MPPIPVMAHTGGAGVSLKAGGGYIIKERIMKILVSTKKTQGQRKNDFSFVPEDEIVKFGFECDGERVDGSCGCRRSLVGTACKKATTTFKVAERDITTKELAQIIYASYQNSGWTTVTMEVAKEDAQELSRIATHFGVDDVLEKRGSRFSLRRVGE